MIPDDTPLTGATTLPDGTLVRGRGRRQPLPEGPRPGFGLALGRPPRAGLLRRRRPEPPSWPLEWVDWPDFRTPGDGRQAADAIVRAHRLARDGTRKD